VLTFARYLTRRCRQETLNGGWRMQTPSSRVICQPFNRGRFTREDAARISQPVLNLCGAKTKPYFREIHETVRTWLPHAENSELSNATHACYRRTRKARRSA